MLRHLTILLTLIFLALPAMAQDADAPDSVDRSATGGAQTLQDIMARQRGEPVDNEFRQVFGDDADGGTGAAFGVPGGASDPDLWRALRYGEADITVSSGGDVGKVLVQDGGMAWHQFRSGPLSKYGSWLLIGTLIALLLFFIFRGRIRLDSPRTGTTVTRFKGFERFAHWLMAGSFILLGITGLLVLLGRLYIAPWLGNDVNATALVISKVIHNNVAWAFMLGLVLSFVFWVWHNFPSLSDFKWIAQFGGIIGKKHPPAKKFNFGQKVIFWSTMILGASISVSGLSLLFPFELPLFAKTFSIINDTGVMGMLGMQPLQVEMTPQQEMQFASTWHALVSFVLMAMIIAHIYIGTLGMEGASSAMGSGQVDETWARQHHSLWYDKVKARAARNDPPPVATTNVQHHQHPGVTPAE